MSHGTRDATPPASVQGCPVPESIWQPAAWQACLEASRAPAALVADPARAAEERAVHLEFKGLLQRTKETARGSWLQQPELRRLSELSLQGTELAKLAYHELCRLDGPDRVGVVPIPLLRTLLNECRALCDTVAAQRAVLELLDPCAEELRQQLLSLVREEPGGDLAPLGYHGMRRLVHRICTAVPAETYLPLLSLHPRLAEDVLTGRFGDPVWAQAIWVGLVTAIRVAHVAWSLWLGPESREVLVAAALLQDAGRFVRRGGDTRGSDCAETSAGDDHPACSAALVGAFGHAPGLLGPLVAAHHRRLGPDTGDRGVWPGKPGLLARLLAAAVRWDELRRTVSGAEAWSCPPSILAQQAAAAWGQETASGAWDGELVKLLLHGEVPSTSRDSAEAGGPCAGGPNLHGGHVGPHTVPEPHLPRASAAAFVWRRKGGERRVVGTTPEPRPI